MIRVGDFVKYCLWELDDKNGQYKTKWRYGLVSGTSRLSPFCIVGCIKVGDHIIQIRKDKVTLIQKREKIKKWWRWL